MQTLRKVAGISQRELARRLGVHHSNISYWETSGNPPRGEVIPAMAKELNTTADELLGIKASKPKKTVAKGRMQKMFEAASKLPRRQQEKIVDLLEPFVREHVNGT